MNLSLALQTNPSVGLHEGQPLALVSPRLTRSARHRRRILTNCERDLRYSELYSTRYKVVGLSPPWDRCCEYYKGGLRAVNTGKIPE